MFCLLSSLFDLWLTSYFGLAVWNSHTMSGMLGWYTHAHFQQTIVRFWLFFPCILAINC